MFEISQSALPPPAWLNDIKPVYRLITPLALYLVAQMKSIVSLKNFSHQGLFIVYYISNF